MKFKMHFWTWKTEEVKALLQWMCSYNRDKPVTEKLQYMGVDCQFNTFQPDLLQAYLDSINASPSIGHYSDILNETRIASSNNFENYSAEEFEIYLEKIDGLNDSMQMHKHVLVDASSEQLYQLQLRILQLIRQVSVVNYHTEKSDFSINYRDQFMAENTSWLLDHFEGEKIVLWAHNGHIADNVNFGGSGSQGFHLSSEHGNAYGSIGFLFSNGSFTAFGQVGQQFTGLGKQEITEIPKANSLNYIVHKSQEPIFSVKLSALQNHSSWITSFANGIEYFQIGAVYNNQGQYYSTFDPIFFDYLIYIDQSSASILL